MMHTTASMVLRRGTTLIASPPENTPVPRVVFVL
jgi:hypothetical protein